MKALVTGAGGFLGGALAVRLKKLGWEIRGFARGRYPALDEWGIESVRGDLADATAVATAVTGCDAVFHVAAKVGAWGDYADFYRSNVVGTQNIIDACRRSGTRRLVFTSTPSVVYSGADIEGGDETLPYVATYDAHYPATKSLAERAVLAANDPHGTVTIALRPHLIWGPGDRQLLPRIIASAKAGKLVRLKGPPKRIDVTYIDDAVEAHVLAAEKLGSDPACVAGNAYFISGPEPVELWWMIDRILDCAGLPPVRRSMTPTLALGIARVATACHQMLRLRDPPALTPWIVKELSTSHWFSIERARRDLGYRPRIAVEEGLARLRTALGSS
jgi:2-alkyl-3-oxoalkanoate reductase